MQVLDVQQSNPTPYTPAGGTYNNNPMPGAGGLPSLSGLNNRANPMAQQLQGQGRGEDSVLVHMTPGEVNSLRGLAQQFGGDLSTNPNTGLPEASFLKKMLPMILGAIAAPLTGGLINPMTAGLLVGAGQTALTGDIRKGLMAGLGAYGGAALGGAAGLGKIGATKTLGGVDIVGGGAQNMLPTGAPITSATGLPMAPGPGGSSVLGLNSAGNNMLGIGTGFGKSAVPSFDAAGFGAPAAATATPAFAPIAPDLAPEILSQTAQLGTAKTGLAGFGQKFGQAASVGLKGAAAKYAPYAAGLGLYGGLSSAMQPSMLTPEEEENKYKYEGPYYPKPRTFRSRTLEEMKRANGAAFDFLEPEPPPVPRMAEGGVASLPAAGDFQAAVDFFSRNSPGAITASMYSPPSVKHVPVPKTSDPATGTGGTTTTTTGGGGPGGGTVGEAASTSRSSPSTNSGGGANAIDLANMYGGRMSSEIASGPPSNNPLPGTTIRGTNVSGQGVMPNFDLEDLVVNPVGAPQINVSSGYGTGSGYSGYNRDFAGSSPFSDMSSNMNSMSSFGSNLDPRITGGNYSFPTATFGGNYGLPTSIFGDSEEFEELKARGGEVGMKEGSFVVDARTVSEMGNGSSNAGIERLAAMGGRPVRGGGDGVSDSVPARIGGKQKARVARDEVIFSPEAIRRLGAGSHSKGTQKLYALMNKAHKARKKARRGQDTKVAKGIGGLA
jgi:hypothetical protein